MTNGTVFLSYTHEDQAIAFEIADRLENENVEIWIDRRRMQLGDSWVNRVEEGLSEASYLLLVATPAALQSRFVKLEYTSVLATLDSRDTVIIPVKAAPCDLPILLRGFIFVDLTVDREQGFRELVEFFGREAAPALPSAVDRNGTDHILTDATRREIRIVTAHCLDEEGFAGFLEEAGINAREVQGRTHHERILHVVHFLASDGQLEVLTRILQEDRRDASEKRLARLRGTRSGGPSLS